MQQGTSECDVVLQALSDISVRQSPLPVMSVGD